MDRNLPHSLEKRLVSDVQEHNTEFNRSFDYLLNHYMGMMTSIVCIIKSKYRDQLNSQFSSEYDFEEELYAIGRVSLLDAIEKYDPLYETKLSSWVYTKMQKAMYHHIHRVLLKPQDKYEATLSLFLDDDVTESFSINEIASDDYTQDSQLDIFEKETQNKIIKNAIFELNPKEKEIVLNVFWDDKSCSDVAKKLGLSRQRVSYIKHNGLRKLEIKLKPLVNS